MAWKLMEEKLWEDVYKLRGQIDSLQVRFIPDAAHSANLLRMFQGKNFSEKEIEVFKEIIELNAKYRSDSALSFSSTAYGEEPLRYSEQSMESLWNLYLQYKSDPMLAENFKKYENGIITSAIGPSTRSEKNKVNYQPKELLDAYLSNEGKLYNDMMSKGIFIFPIDYRYSPESGPIDPIYLDRDYLNLRDLTCVKATLDATARLGGTAKVSIFMGAKHNPPFEKIGIKPEISPLFEPMTEKLAEKMNIMIELALDRKKCQQQSTTGISQTYGSDKN